MNRATNGNLSATSTIADPEDLLTIREVAIRLRVDATTVRRWIAHDLLEVVTLPHIGKRRVYRVKKATLDRLLQAGREPHEHKAQAPLH